MYPSDLPTEVFEAALKIVEERVVMFGAKIKEKANKLRKAKRILQEAEAWPLSRCVDVLPFVGNVISYEVGRGHASSLNDDGCLRFCLAVIWLAPFPAHYVSLDFQCRLLLPSHPIGADCRYVTYTANGKQVVDTLPDGRIEYLDGVRVIDLKLMPDSPVTAEELGPKSHPADQTKLGRLVEVKELRITAYAPWRKLRDSEYLHDFSIWVPRY